MMKSPVIWSLAIAVALAGIILILLTGTGPESGEDRTSQSGQVAPGGGLLDGIIGSAEGEQTDSDTDVSESDAPAAGPLSQEAMSAEIDLVAIRKALPDNLYWELKSPTEDAAELKRRAARQAEIDKQYGRVQANIASEQEIHSYYDFQKRQSEDYVKFLKYLMTKHGDELSQRDEGLYGLGIKIHTARLKDIPRAREDAQKRRVVHDRKRQEWLAGQN